MLLMLPILLMLLMLLILVLQRLMVVQVCKRPCTFDQSTALEGLMLLVLVLVLVMLLLEVTVVLEARRRSIGSRNASVFPDPVCATIFTLSPPMASGRHRACTSLGAITEYSSWRARDSSSPTN